MQYDVSWHHRERVGQAVANAGARATMRPARAVWIAYANDCVRS